jgi:DNA-binding CsgD family transcriptional regulator
MVRQWKKTSAALTDREIEVLLLAASGRSNRSIARILCISIRTVDQHIQSMLRRTEAEDRAELVARCYAGGILRSGVWPPAWSGHYCMDLTGR